MIDPVAIDLGFTVIRWYGIMAAFTILGGIVLGRYWASHFSIDTDAFDTVALMCVPAWIIGSRAAYVLANLPYYRGRPWEIIRIDHGGLASQGGLFLTFAVAWLSTRRMKIPFWALADSLAPSFALGHICIRIGNFANGELYGAPTGLPWGMVFPGTFEPRHPSMLYEGAGAVLILALSVMWAKQRRLEGEAFLKTLISMSILRFLVDMTRGPGEQVFAGLAMSQILALAYIAVAFALMCKHQRTANPGT
ncbi:MAG TPA: prolipoprotein diacylglyceryl transferase [Firmicutes bacterium]|nr:prolipoprotein diacylglyceryl transferase [Candidatus Fermentithermobacillaceae bacterium]